MSVQYRMLAASWQASRGTRDQRNLGEGSKPVLCPVSKRIVSSRGVPTGEIPGRRPKPGQGARLQSEWSQVKELLDAPGVITTIYPFRLL